MPDFIEDYVKETAAVPSPECYRLWAGITAVSGVLERKTWTCGSAGPIYPSLYTLLVGPPASGKTNAIRPIHELWSNITGLHISPDNVTKAALIDALSKSVRTVINGADSAHIFSSMVVPCSEFGVFLTKHDVEFLSVLNYIYDGPIVYVEERRTAGRTEITKPNLVILAGTQPDFLNSILPEEAWGMGFTSRLLMIYADAVPSKDLFAKATIQASSLLEKLTQIFDYHGEFIWDNDAKAELNAWFSAGCPPAPTHAKLSYYNGRRSIYIMKLAMISSASRGADMVITMDDFERARDWLLAVELTMPDIFTAMGQKSDKQILSDLHFHLYRSWSSVSLKERKPLQEKVLYDFLHARVPSERINRLIEVALKTGYIRPGTYPGEYIPNSLTTFDNV